MANDLLAYYAAPGVFTGVSGFEDQIDAIPGDIASVVNAVQGLLIHEALAPAYKVSLTEVQRTQKQVHSAQAMLTAATKQDSRPLTESRKPRQRAVGVCRHFATLFVAILRHKGIPSRVRAGFANYFDKTQHAEHWVGEYWNASEARWTLVDAQIDGPQRDFFKPGIDTLDVPRDRFLVAGDAWRLCRAGAADPKTFGVAGTTNWGLIEVFGEIFQDLAALQKIELLPWGWYGLATEDVNCEKEAALADQLAAISSSADAASLDRLRRVLDMDQRLRVPSETLTAHVAADQAAIAAATLEAR